MANFTGKLNANENYAALFNMIISHTARSNILKGLNSSLVEMARVDGSEFGDTKLETTTNILPVYDFGGDADGENLLKPERQKEVQTQAFVMDVFKQIRVTTDEYLSKRAWMDEGSFAQFTAMILSLLEETRRTYDNETYNAYIGTVEGAAAIHELSISKAEFPTLGQAMGATIADLLIDLKDTVESYNDYGYTRSYAPEDIIIVWNKKYANEIRKIDLPALFHKEGLVDKFDEKFFEPSRWFGVVNGEDVTVATAKTRSLVYQTITVEGVAKKFRAGQSIPVGTSLVGVKSYEEDATIIGKVMCRDSVPYMSAFRATGSFYNPQNLTRKNILNFGHNTLDYRKDEPMITLKLGE